MALSTWPSSLPERFEPQGFSLQPVSQTIETPVDVGPVRLRRRSSLSVVRINGSVQLDSAQRDTFITFYMQTLQGGSLSFNWNHPYDASQSVTMKFVKPDPKLTVIGSLEFRAAINLEMQL